MLQRQLRIFLCHASQDKLTVRELYQKLLAQGWIDPWLDEKKLLPGMDWEEEIQKAVEAADAVLVCFSQASLKKVGYVQKELRFVLDVALQQPLDEPIFIIPLRLDDCSLPRVLRARQYVDYFPIEKKSQAFNRLLTSLRMRATELQIYIPNESTAQRIEDHTDEISFINSQEKSQAGSTPHLDIPLEDEGRIVLKLEQFVLSFCPIPPQQPLFLIASTLVSNELFYQFTLQNQEWSPTRKGIQPKNGEDGYLAHWVDGHPRANDKNLPVININFLAAEEFIRWLGNKLNLNLRLPTVSEWTLAAKAGRANWLEEEIKEGRVNYFETYNKLSPIDAFSANPYGVHDLLGNAYDLCVEADTSGHREIHRVGGCYYSTKAQLHSLYKVDRSNQYLESTSFRCVRDL